MANENKNKKRSILEFIDGEQLSKAQAKKLKHPNDPEVLELERKHPTVSINGEVCKDRPLYLYEPHVRYERSENPDYARYRNYSLAGTITGLGVLVTGLASFNYTLAYAGAALTITSLGYQSGHWYSKYKTDRRFEKISGLEKKVEEPVEESKAEALYVRRTHKSYETGHAGGGSMYYGSLSEPQPRYFHRYSGPGTVGILLTGFLTAAVASDYIKGWGVDVPLLYATGATALVTSGHYVGFIFGKRRAKPKYKNVSELEKKVEEKD